MFTIDLLKGQGLPMKSRPEGIVIAAVTLAVPVIIAIAMFSYYLRSRIVISIKKQDIVNYDAKIGKLADSIKLQKSLEEEKIVYSKCLAEVQSSIVRHTQWSSILAAIIGNMPESVVLSGISVKKSTIRKKVPKKDNPEETIEITVPVRTLHMSIYGSPLDRSGEAVREFRDRLWLSSLLGPKLENIGVSQKTTRFDNKDVVSYEIDCIFKPGM